MLTLILILMLMLAIFFFAKSAYHALKSLRYGKSDYYYVKKNYHFFTSYFILALVTSILGIILDLFLEMEFLWNFIVVVFCSLITFAAFSDHFDKKGIED